MARHLEPHQCAHGPKRRHRRDLALWIASRQRHRRNHWGHRHRGTVPVLQRHQHAASHIVGIPCKLRQRGIGTTTPTAPLDVFGQSSDGYAAVFKSAAGSTGAVGIGSNDGNYGFIQGLTSDTLTNVSNLLLNPAGGNVGIATTSPAYALDVNGTVAGTSSTAAAKSTT